MSFLEITYPEVYRDYLSLEDRSVEGVINFYELNFSSIDMLDFEKKFEIRNLYVQALFEIGNYQRFLTQIDWLIVKVMEENIEIYDGIDLYEHCIFRKAAALYNLNQSNPALIIAKKLVRINPRSKTNSLLLKKAYLKKGYTAIITWQLAGALVLTASVMVYCFEVYYLIPRGIETLSTFQGFRYTTGVIGFMLILLPEIWHQISAIKLVRSIRRSSRR